MFVFKNLLFSILVFFLSFTIASAKDDVSKKSNLSYSINEVMKHNSDKSCWVVMDKLVYDVTTFLPNHPGTAKVLRRCCGKDCTKKFNDKAMGSGPHQDNAFKIRKKLIIGKLKKGM